jgi:hypothetical protein
MIAKGLGNISMGQNALLKKSIGYTMRLVVKEMASTVLKKELTNKPMLIKLRIPNEINKKR